MKGFADLYHLSENQRIEVIGRAVIDNRGTIPDKPFMVAVIVESHQVADRYERKLKKRFPAVRIIDRHDGPAKGLVTLRIGEALQ